MKTWPFLLLPVFAWISACSSPPVRVTGTCTATGATDPKAIYIRPFRLKSFDNCSPSGDRCLRASLAPVEFANDLQEQLAKIAPARVLKEDEAAPLGWLVDGEFEGIESGYRPERWMPWRGPWCNPLALPSCVKMHVRISDARRGTLLYAFDVKAYSDGSLLGSVTRPGGGYPLPFDFRNAAEQVAIAITPDPFRYGARCSPAIRY
jgi:hypothetical protein